MEDGKRREKEMKKGEGEGRRGTYTDDQSFEASLLDYMRSTEAPLMKTINEAGAYDNAIEAKLKHAVEEFKRTASW